MRKTAVMAAALLAAVFAGCTSGPKEEKAAEKAESREPVKVPETYQVRFETTKGDFVVEVNREWAPRGADRFHELVRTGFYDGARFYRVRPKFIVQFGISTNPEMNELWRQLKMPDDPVKQPNRRGYLSFAHQGPATRTTQVFINLGNNSAQLDSQKFAPFARVTEGMEVVDKMYAGYGEVQGLGGGGPDTVKMEQLGEEYIERSYSRLDQIKKATIL